MENCDFASVFSLDWGCLLITRLIVVDTHTYTDPYVDPLGMRPTIPLEILCVVFTFQS